MAFGIGIVEVGERTGLSVHTLRFYERQGMLPSPISRDEAGRRRFSEGDIEWVEACVRLRATGMSISEIREYVALVREGVGNEQERLEILRTHERRVVAQRHELNACLRLIRTKIRYYESPYEA